jgi:hypothetical protein
MKLIDADKLKTELDAWARIIRKPNCYSREDALHIIDTAPEVKAVPVVRKPVKGYEGYYEVDNLARVFSLDRTVRVSDNGREYDKPVSGKKLKQGVHSKGYKTVSLTKDGVTKTVFVHRIVADAFIPNESGLPMLNHIDEDKTNNLPENLEWCDAKYNRNYGKSIEKQAKKIRGRESEKRVPVEQYTLSNDFVAWFPSIAIAAKEVNGSTGAISAVCKGKRKSAYGYIWKYCSYGAKMESEGST